MVLSFLEVSMQMFMQALFLRSNYICLHIATLLYFQAMHVAYKIKANIYL